mmetsp:Transcript_2402/g.4048  ORF Transcript_2402/g.4048 Transcript_2402/m.4048 type:complete len:90 (+) Transcript_2402:4353-4622(+)
MLQRAHELLPQRCLVGCLPHELSSNWLDNRKLGLPSVSFTEPQSLTCKRSQRGYKQLSIDQLSCMRVGAKMLLRTDWQAGWFANNFDDK